MENRLKVILYLLTFAFLLQSFSPVFMSDCDCIEIVENTEEQSMESYKDLKISFENTYLFSLNMREKREVKKFILLDETRVLETFHEVNVPPPRV